MLYLISTFIITTSISIFMYNIDLYNIIYNSINTKYIKWKKINALVASQHNSIINIYRISIKMILQVLYISLLQYLNNTVVKLDKNTFQITYVIKGKIYKMILIPNRYPTKILDIRDEYDNDLTEDILSYYGPNYDWHNISFIPQFFNCKQLIFQLDDGTEKIFNEIDYIEKIE